MSDHDDDDDDDDYEESIDDIDVIKEGEDVHHDDNYDDDDDDDVDNYDYEMIAYDNEEYNQLIHDHQENNVDDPGEVICSTKSLDPKTKRNSSSSSSSSNYAAPITTNFWSDDENDHDDNPGGVICPDRILNPKPTRSSSSSSRRSSSSMVVNKRSTTSLITNYFPVATTKLSNPKLKQHIINISSKQSQEIVFSSTSKSKQPPAILSIKQSAADKAKSNYKKITKRRAARANARSRMEMEARRITFKNKMENTTTEVPKIYSLSIECLKRRRAVNKKKKKDKQQW